MDLETRQLEDDVTKSIVNSTRQIKDQKSCTEANKSNSGEPDQTD